jgi:hypothetical protein
MESRLRQKTALMLVESIVNDQIELLLEKGDRLESLVHQSDQLHTASRMFMKTAGGLPSRSWFGSLFETARGNSYSYLLVFTPNI